MFKMLISLLEKMETKKRKYLLREKKLNQFNGISIKLIILIKNLLIWSIKKLENYKKIKGKIVYKWVEKMKKITKKILRKLKQE